MADKADQAAQLIALGENLQSWRRPQTPQNYPCYVEGRGLVTINATSVSDCISKLETQYGVGQPGRDDFALHIPKAHHHSGAAYRGNAQLIQRLQRALKR